MNSNHPQLSASVNASDETSGSRDGQLRVSLASPSLAGVLRIVLVLIASIVAVYLAWRIRGVVRLLAISLFFSFALFPVVDILSRRTRTPRGVAILVLYAVLLVLVALIGYVVIPSLVNELQSLSHNAPHYAAELRRNASFRHLDDRFHMSAKLVRDAHRLPELLTHLAGPLKDVTVGAFGLVTQLITVLAVTFLLVLHGRRYTELALALTGSHQARYRRVIVDIKNAVAAYTLGNIVISVLATIATAIVLSLLGVPYALALGLVVGFFDLIPLIGATLGAIVVVLATLPVSFPTATIVWIVFIVVWQRFEDYVVQPFVYGRALKINPLVTIVSLLIGGALLGILGVLLAIPTAAAMQIILREWWAARKSAEPAKAPDGQQTPRAPGTRRETVASLGPTH